MHRIARLPALLIAVALVASTVAAQYHPPHYLVAGAPRIASQPSPSGVYHVDASGSRVAVTTLFQPRGYVRAIMDGDNRSVLVAVQGSSVPNSLTQNRPNMGLYRVDPANNAVTTLFSLYNAGTRYISLYDTVLDYHGDYVSASYNFDTQQPSQTAWGLVRITPTGTLSTLLSTINVRGYLPSEMTRDMRTGRLLLTNYLGPAGVMAYDIDTGTISTFSPASLGVLATQYSMPQDHATGAIELASLSWMLRLMPGASTYSTLATLSVPARGGGEIDLQTARSRRWIYATHDGTGNNAALMTIADGTYAVSTQPIGLADASDDVEFYRGRHTQTVRSAPRQWSILLSAPMFPGRAYAVALGLSGTTPATPLPGGRQLNLRIDALSALTIADAVRPRFHPGSGVLAANGAATARLDMRGTPLLGIPLWIAWMVFDPAAPGGIAFVPDTYVMRI